MKCLHCNQGSMEKPKDDHPSYMVCPSCGVIELTYQPLDYQEAVHTVPYEVFINKRGLEDIRPQIIFIAGG